VLSFISLPFVHQAYLRVQLGNIALDGARLNEAVEHFTAAANASTFFYKLPIHLMYDEFVAVRWYCSTENSFMPNYVFFSTALWLGPEVLVAHRKPATVLCTLSSRQL
jgi:hypothetical protein